jgi:mono/diheme cytochrome c family protein
MKKFFRILAYVFLVLVVGIIGLISYVKLAFPKVDEDPDIRIELTPERISRGQYLAHSVAACMDCHSVRDWNKFSGPLKEGTYGGGGEVFNQKMGFPGTYTAKNLTPYALKEWTDGEIFRAITGGVNKDGKALFPVMPYHNYTKADREDIYSIIAFLRSLEPVASDIPPSRSDFPMSLIINVIPKNPSLTEMPDPSDKVNYGGYLTNLAGCIDCHTPMEKGKPVISRAFSGGREFGLMTGGMVRSTNITPDKETGIGNWTEEAFISRFKAYADSSFIPPEIHQGEFNTLMPWTIYSTMKEEDLAAIYAYLQSLEPIHNKVERFTVASRQ